MIKEALNSSDLWIWPASGLVIFLGVTILTYLWIMRPKAKVFYEQMAVMVFDEEKKEGNFHGK